MKRRILLSLSAVFLFFAVGAVIATVYITTTTASLSRVIRLHQIEHIRQDLVISIQTVQADLYTVHTPLAKRLDSIVKNVITLDEAAARCTTCHHPPDLYKEIRKLEDLTGDYKNALSYYITASANLERIEEIKLEAARIGDQLLGITQGMTVTASKKLQKVTAVAMEKINAAKMILFGTLIAAFFLALVVSVYLTISITRPVKELVHGTRMIAMGNLGHTLSYRDKTEFGELTENFNSMSMALKEGYEKLTESEWKFRTLSEFSHDWEYWITEDMRIVFMSPSCERITGYSQDDFITARPTLINEVVHPDDRELYLNHIADFKTPQHEGMEFRIVTEDGSVRWISHVCGPIFIKEKFLGRRVSNRDITDSKRLEEQLAQSQKMESLGLLAGGIAHDFNNLLTAIMGYTSLLQQTLGDRDEKSKRFIQSVMRASERAQNLTAHLLTFGRKQIIELHAVSLRDVIENISELVKRLIGEDIELRITYSSVECPVFGDPHQIEQVVMNLATNARDAMPNGGILAVETRAVTLDDDLACRYGGKPGKYMMLSVTDSGAGIDEKDMAHIFEPFYTTKEKGKGTGLGLAIVYGIIKQHDGFFNVESAKGCGTTFEIYLPVKETCSTFPIKSRNQPGTELSGTGTILLAEDEETVRGFVKDTLEFYGYETIVAVDGEDAIRKYAEHRNDINMLMLDVVMPKKNGKEVYNLIHRDNPGIKALFMSGYTQDILTSKGIYEEGLEFISKPLEIESMVNKVRSMLNRT